MLLSGDISARLDGGGGEPSPTLLEGFEDGLTGYSGATGAFVVTTAPDPTITEGTQAIESDNGDASIILNSAVTHDAAVTLTFDHYYTGGSGGVIYAADGEDAGTLNGYEIYWASGNAELGEFSSGGYSTVQSASSVSVPSSTPLELEVILDGSGGHDIELRNRNDGTVAFSIEVTDATHSQDGNLGFEAFGGSGMGYDNVRSE